MSTFDHRLEVAQRLFETVLEVTATPEVRRQLPEAGDRARYLISHGVLVEPLGQRLCESGRVLRRGAARRRGHPWLRIFLLLPSDARRSPVFSYYEESVSCAAYACGTHTVVVKPFCGETDRFLAMCLLHEVGHAVRAVRERRAFRVNARPWSERIAEEVDMWTFDAHLTAALGGEPYAAAVEEVSREILHGIRASGDFTPTEEGRGKILDLVYGAPSATEFRHVRDMSVYLFCALTVVADRLCTSDNARQWKADLLSRTSAPRGEQVRNILSTCQGLSLFEEFRASL